MHAPPYPSAVFPGAMTRADQIELDATYAHHDEIPDYPQLGTLPETKSDVLGHPIPAEVNYPSVVDWFARNQDTGFTDPSWYHQALNTFSKHAMTRLNAPPSWEHQSRDSTHSKTLQSLDRHRAKAMLADVNALKEHPSVVDNSMSGRALRDATHTIAERALLRRVSHALAVRSQTLREATDADELPNTLDENMLSNEPWSSAMVTGPTTSSQPAPFFLSHGMKVQSGARKHIVNSLHDYVDAMHDGSIAVHDSSPSDVPMTAQEHAHHAYLSSETSKAHYEMGDDDGSASSAAFLQHLHRIAVLLDRRELTNRFDSHFPVDWEHDPYLDDGAPSEAAIRMHELATARAKRRRTTGR